MPVLRLSAPKGRTARNELRRNQNRRSVRVALDQVDQQVDRLTSRDLGEQLELRDLDLARVLQGVRTVGCTGAERGQGAGVGGQVEVAHHGRATVVVDDPLDDRELRGRVVVRDRAGDV